MKKFARYGILLGLLTGGGQVCRADSLDWGSLFTNGAAASPQTGKYLSSVLADVRKLSGKTFTAVPRIISQGHLPTDPGVAESRAAAREIPSLLKLAVCARKEEDPAQKELCFQAARAGLMAWATTYKPSGDPINEAVFIPWAQALDVMEPLLGSADKARLHKFARSLIAAGDRFYGNMRKSDGRYYNNWGTYRLCERAFLAAATGDKNAVKATGKMLDAHLQHNLLADGQSIDFRDRDAFHYHVYDMYPLVKAATQMPKGFMSGASMARIEKSLNFMRPHFLGAKQHIEFANTTVAFDITRKKAGLKDYQNQPWDPAGARETLRLGRVPFPGIRSWTSTTLGEKYDNMFKLMVSALEDRR